MNQHELRGLIAAAFTEARMHAWTNGVEGRTISPLEEAASNQALALLDQLVERVPEEALT